MNFWKTSEGGVISDPKNVVAFFCGSLQSEKFDAKKCNIVFRNEGGGGVGGGQRPFGSFPKIHTKMNSELSLTEIYSKLAKPLIQITGSKNIQDKSYDYLASQAFSVRVTSESNLKAADAWEEIQVNLSSSSHQSPSLNSR